MTIIVHCDFNCR